MSASAEAFREAARAVIEQEADLLAVLSEERFRSDYGHAAWEKQTARLGAMRDAVLSVADRLNIKLHF